MDKVDLPTRKVNWKLLLEIFVTFFKISPITFGGGFAMIPILEREMVDKKKWVDKMSIIDIFAVSQSVPGAIAVNSSIFLGYQIAGIPGALAAMFGIILPTFGIIIILSILFLYFQDNSYVQAALKGIRPTIAALIAAAAYKMGAVSLVDKTSWSVCILCLLVLLIFRNLNLVIVILAGAFLGIILLQSEKVIRRAAANKDKNSGC